MRVLDNVWVIAIRVQRMGCEKKIPATLHLFDWGKDGAMRRFREGTEKAVRGKPGCCCRTLPLANLQVPRVDKPGGIEQRFAPARRSVAFGRHFPATCRIGLGIERVLDEVPAELPEVAPLEVGPLAKEDRVGRSLLARLELHGG